MTNSGKFFVVACLAISASACSNKGMHSGIQQAERMECMALPESQYAACLERVNETYEQYERKVRTLKSETE